MVLQHRAPPSVPQVLEHLLPQVRQSALNQQMHPTVHTDALDPVFMCQREQSPWLHCINNMDEDKEEESTFSPGGPAGPVSPTLP